MIITISKWVVLMQEYPLILQIILVGFIASKALLKNVHASDIHLILNNRQKSFQDSTIIETGLSTFHTLTAAVIKSYFKELEQKLLIYHRFENFSNQ